MSQHLRLPEGIPRKGQLFEGKYQIDAPLGVGGMGIVVAARHLGLGQTVAIKFLHPRLGDDERIAARFLREARAIAGLGSEHIVRVHDAGKSAAGLHYIVMEHLVGADLDKTLRTRGPLPVAEVADFVIQVCEALAEAHSIGIVHRDLKPGNIFLSRRTDGSMHIKVLDFGISKMDDADEASGDLTSAADMLGSPWYMSPEQVRCSKTVDRRTDVWALGVLLHQLLTGQTPFGGANMACVLARIVADPPARLRDGRPDAPPELERVILRCLEKERSRRVQSVAELARALLPLAPAHAGARVERIAKVLGETPPEPSTQLLSPSAGGEAQRRSGQATAPPPALVTELLTPPDRSGTVHASAREPVPLPSVPPAATLPGMPVGASTSSALISAPRRTLTRSRLIPGLSGWIAASAAVVVVAVQFLNGRAPAPPQSASTGTSAASISSSPPVLVPPDMPSSVEVHVHLSPSTALLELDGALTTSSTVRLDRSAKVHRLVAMAVGYLPATREFTADADRDLIISLEADRAAPAPSPSAPARPEPGTTDFPRPPPPPVSPPPVRPRRPAINHPADYD